MFLLYNMDVNVSLGTSKGNFFIFISSVNYLLLLPLSRVLLSATPWTVAHQTPLPFTISQSLLKFLSTELVMLSNNIILCCFLLLLPSFFPNIKVFFQLFASGCQSIRASALASVLPMNIQG